MNSLCLKVQNKTEHGRALCLGLESPSDHPCSLTVCISCYHTNCGAESKRRSSASADAGLWLLITSCWKTVLSESCKLRLAQLLSRSDRANCLTQFQAPRDPDGMPDCRFETVNIHPLSEVILLVYEVPPSICFTELANAYSCFQAVFEIAEEVVKGIPEIYMNDRPVELGQPNHRLWNQL